MDKKQLLLIEKFCLASYAILVFSATIVFVTILPYPEIVAKLPNFSKFVLKSAIKHQFVLQTLLATIATCIHAYRTIGIRQMLIFMVPSMVLPFSAEMLTIKTGFPFGHFVYPDGNGINFTTIGLGYKVAGLVPWTIALWWFSGSLAAYLLARAALEAIGLSQRLSQIGAVIFGAMLITAWDFAFEPSMHLSAVRFWNFQQSGAYFGIPAFSFTSFMIVLVLFMSVAARFWRQEPLQLEPSQLNLPLVNYLTNLGAAFIFDIFTHMWIPLAIGVIFGLAPTLTFCSIVYHKETGRDVINHVST